MMLLYDQYAHNYKKNPLKHKLDHMQYIFAYELHVYKPFIYLVISSD